ncbi:MAG: ABC transporter ATP-binding protein [Desulfuromonadales bacterium]|nr:ABC transporter ATP-binding protein [Desulfuromonadales bacterium]
MNSATLVVRDVTKVFDLGAVQVHALRGVTLSIDRGEFVAVMGTSGSGKSTLMNILGCLDLPSAGAYLLEGIPVDQLGRNALATIRNEKIGFVFQGFNLLPRTTALENVELPLLYDRRHRIAAPSSAAEAALVRVGLGDRLDHLPNQLSGGQQQRVAIARALVTAPAIILADEPTGNLDSRTTLEVLAVFQQLNREGMTIVIVTHEPEVARYTSRIVELRDGLVQRDLPVPLPGDAAADLAATRQRVPA